ncbi:MAG: HAD family hydrolase [Deltaproteobacteria bacterium]|jgi:phosphoglycolate phosphatase|nr:HAD family hydrolase [Deltaproteobacteria bacterium]
MAAKAAIFDLDGTLLDSLHDLRDALEMALMENGIERHYDDGAFKLMVGNGLAKLIERALPPGSPLAPKLRADYKAIYSKNLSRKTKPFPGVPGLVSRLKAEGFGLGVWTNKDDDLAKSLVGSFFPGAFSVVMGSAPDRPNKPDPHTGLALAGALGASPAELYYLGDGDADMIAANNCGFIPVGVLWGYRSREVLLSAGARYLLSEPADFHAILGAAHG